MADEKDVMWCVRCGARFTAEEVQGVSACPKCGDDGVPCDTDQDVKVEVNWHELRILTIWAENWARECAANKADQGRGVEMPKTVLAIARRLQRQFPDFTPLTLSEEIAGLPKALEENGITVGSVESSIGAPVPLPINGPGAVGYWRTP